MRISLSAFPRIPRWCKSLCLGHQHAIAALLMTRTMRAPKITSSLAATPGRVVKNASRCRRLSRQEMSTKGVHQAAACQRQSIEVQLLSQQPAQTRRQLLGALVAAPLVLKAFQLPVPALAAEQAAVPRFLTPAAQAAVNQALNSTLNTAKAPTCLRLVFHDFGPYRPGAPSSGANASIQFELDRRENYGLKKGWRVIKETMDALKGTAAEGAVSYADLIALAGAHSVRITGGPAIPVPVGRRDADAADPEGRMPREDASAVQQLEMFGAQGFTPREFLALCGAHTLGGKGYGDPLTFDNTYFKTLLQKPWADTSNSMNQHVGIPTDHVLPDDPTCMPIIKEYASDQDLFFREFAAAYVKATSLGQWA